MSRTVLHVRRRAFTGRQPAARALPPGRAGRAHGGGGRGRLPVMAHAQATDGIKNAVRAGIRSIEHGIYLDDEAIDMMLAAGTWLVPTLVETRSWLSRACFFPLTQLTTAAPLPPSSVVPPPPPSNTIMSEPMEMDINSDLPQDRPLRSEAETPHGDYDDPPIPRRRRALDSRCPWLSPRICPGPLSVPCPWPGSSLADRETQSS